MAEHPPEHARDDHDRPAPHDPRNDTATFHREIHALETRLEQNPDTTQHLSWDTELLTRKTHDFTPANTVSAKHPAWKQTLAHLEIGPEGVCIADVRTVDAIEYIAAFAADRQLTMTYGNRTFLLEPRDPNTLA